MNMHNQNFRLLLPLAKWRDEEWKDNNIKKAKKIQKAIRNIMFAKDRYAERI